MKTNIRRGYRPTTIRGGKREGTNLAANCTYVQIQCRSAWLKYNCKYALASSMNKSYPTPENSATNKTCILYAIAIMIT